MIVAKEIFLGTHNILRWVILGIGIFASVRMYLGWAGGKAWNKFDRFSGLFFTIILDIQLMLGLLLYFVFSDLTKTAFSNFSVALRNPTIRFFTIYHALLMGLAILIAHIGNSFGKKDISGRDKHLRTAVAYSVTFLLLLLVIPWTKRPLLPNF